MEMTEMKSNHLAKEEIGMSLQSWLWVRDELIAL